MRAPTHETFWLDENTQRSYSGPATHYVPRSSPIGIHTCWIALAIKSGPVGRFHGQGIRAGSSRVLRACSLMQLVVEYLPIKLCGGKHARLEDLEAWVHLEP